MNNEAPAVISVKNVSKDFLLPHERQQSIKKGFTQIFKKSSKRSVEVQHALKDVSFEVKEGEFFGIVGRNGSGKSTLLKILAEIYRPSKGSVKVKGRLVPFIELGVGFNPELTGRENVYLNGAMLGFTKEQINDKYDDIVKFAELERFMDQKLKNYSSGMQVRLAFSIAIQADADILVLDEVLAVGDEAFQRKCFNYFAELKRDKKTVILVTHSMDSVQQFCTKAMLIDKNHDVEIGKPHKIAQIYRELNDQDGVTVNPAQKNLASSSKYVSANVEHIKMDGKHIFDINLKPKAEIDDPVVAMGIYRDTGEEVYRWASDEKVTQKTLNIQNQNNFRIELTDIFPVGIFTVNLYIKKKDRSLDYAVFNEVVKFEIKNLSKFVHNVRWQIPEKTFVNGKEVENVH